ncbi:hypothetical protein C6T57_10150 [Burkholderia multivorans]|nr:hypothetical protein C6T57_10150 [Burkholderia multivorans]
MYVRAKPISRYFEIFSEVAGISFLYLMKSPCVMPPIVERFPQASRVLDKIFRSHQNVAGKGTCNEMVVDMCREMKCDLHLIN